MAEKLRDYVRRHTGYQAFLPDVDIGDDVLRSRDNTDLPCLKRDGWSNEKMRVGSPPLLGLPLETVKLFPHPALSLFQKIRPSIFEILTAKEVKYSSADLVIRRTEHDYYFPRRCYSAATIFINAKAQKDLQPDWAFAVNDIRQLLEDVDLTKRRFGVDFFVEIMDQMSLSAPWYTHSLKMEHTLHRDWEKILNEIVEPAYDSLLASLPESCGGR